MCTYGFIYEFWHQFQAPEGIHYVCKRFPFIKIVTSEIDVAVNDEFCVIPGLGDFGDRYFGTNDYRLTIEDGLDDTPLLEQNWSKLTGIDLPSTSLLEAFVIW
jgi:hypothetical protein